VKGDKTVAVTEQSERLLLATKEFNKHEKRKDGNRVASGLSYGLSLLSDSLYLRMHYDVKTILGQDSMLMPLNEAMAQHNTLEEIGIYQAAESATAADRFDYLAAKDDWYLQWLGRLILGNRPADAKVLLRLAACRALSDDQRRLTFSDTLARILPESRMTPLVLFRLLPWAVQITTALAFADNARAMDIRRRQAATLPIIAACRQCRGSVLEIGEHCDMCGNPLWKYKWLISDE
jgi:hypothetical protein